MNLLIHARREISQAGDVEEFCGKRPKPNLLKDTLYERFGLHSLNPYDQCETLVYVILLVSNRLLPLN
jgi:hypothetical protein